jgi:hypothetical protein
VSKTTTGETHPVPSTHPETIPAEATTAVFLLTSSAVEDTGFAQSASPGNELAGIVTAVLIVAVSAVVLLIVILVILRYRQLRRKGRYTISSGTINDTSLVYNYTYSSSTHHQEHPYDNMEPNQLSNFPPTLSMRLTPDESPCPATMRSQDESDYYVIPNPPSTPSSLSGTTISPIAPYAVATGSTKRQEGHKKQNSPETPETGSERPFAVITEQHEMRFPDLPVIVVSDCSVDAPQRESEVKGVTNKSEISNEQGECTTNTEISLQANAAYVSERYDSMTANIAYEKHHSLSQEETRTVSNSTTFEISNNYY